ncbi:WhiB family transcriptional regulator [Glutamicibacter sp. PS]|uniref:WhiB family transcriptional regulator n=1 Tax=Glutamicibacter sp. PS TaxID=3075634 RepID=UPI0028528AB2|nr:WhiB family transcriptional regulator [Glutamicibacter sp. PS]
MANLEQAYSDISTSAVASSQYGLEGAPSDWFVDPQAEDQERDSLAEDLEKAADALLEREEEAQPVEATEAVSTAGSWAPELDEDEQVRDSIKAVWLGVGGDLDEGELGWQARALCAQTDPEAFFPEKGGSTRDAKRVCGACAVRSECLEYALSNDERFGIWGGLSERERRRLRKRAI